MPAIKSVLLIVASLIVFISKGVAATDQATFKQFEKEVTALQKRYQAPGLAIAIVKDNQIVYAQGFGYRDLKNRLAVTPDTLFSIGSITKSFTSGMIGVLEGNNKLSLDARPIEYFPSIAFNSDEMNQQIQVKDLLSHASGLGNLDGSLVLFPDTDKKRVLNRLPYLKQEGKTKDSWIYSNFAYSIAGAIIEQTSGQSWQTYLQQSLFNPLAMNNTYSSLASMLQTKNYALAYGKVGQSIKQIPFEDFHANEPAGAIFSSVNDMSNWMIAWLNEGKFEGNQVIPSDYVKKATQLQNIMPQQGADAQVFLFGDGYGWRMNAHKGHYKVHHGGNTSGFSAQLTMYPDQQIGIVALTNQTSSILPQLAIDMLTNQLLGLEKTPQTDYPVVVRPVFEIPNSPITINEHDLPNKALSSYAGDYTAKGFGTVKIRQQDKFLMIDFPELKLGLRHVKDQTFEMYGVEEFPRFFDPRYAVKFITDKNNKIMGFKIYLQSTPVTFEKS